MTGTLALQDLFRRHRARATGVWKLGSEPSRTVFLDSGDIVFAQSNHPAERLTAILVDRGRLTQAQLDYAMANLKPGLSIGKNLIEMGFITQRDLLDVARAQVERIVFGCLGTSDLVPEFEAKELDPTVVRLPFDTPAMLLAGTLGLKDRESLLELLGPLNQVVVLEGRRLFEINLPLDLAKLPSLLDGARTLLELARESGVEPLRIGAFALFLREIGWARLHELPPLDRGALDLALAADAAPLAPPLPLPAEERPTLMETIKAAERPTTNLEHLSASLDEIALPPPAPEEPFEPSLDAELPAEEPPPFHIITGRIEIPTPSVELPEPPEFREEMPADPAEPPLPIAVPEGLSEEPPAFAEPAPAPRARTGLVFGAVALLVIGGAAGFAWKRWSAPRPAGPAAKQTPPPAAPQPRAEPTPEPNVEPKAEPKVEPKAEAKVEPVPPAKPEPRPEPKPPAKPAARAVETSPEARMAALRGGDLTTALAQGAAHLAALPRDTWMLRLEIACLGETLQKAARMLEGERPDLFIRPIAMRDGRTCYQVFLGRYPSKAAAEKAIPRLPAAFRVEGNKPRAFRADEIPQ